MRVLLGGHDPAMSPDVRAATLATEAGGQPGWAATSLAARADVLARAAAAASECGGAAPPCGGAAPGAGPTVCATPRRDARPAWQGPCGPDERSHSEDGDTQ